VQRALSNGVRFAWLTFDEWYGGKPPLLRGLERLGQNYVAELPANFRAWTKPPEVMYREHARDRYGGHPRKLPRLKVRNTPSCAVRNVRVNSPKLRRVPWIRYRVKDGEKGPLVWEAKCLPVWIKDEDGLPTGPYHLLLARNVLNPDGVKFFLSNAPESVSVETLRLVAFSRWRIERMFEDTKDELGLDHFEVRRYVAIQRHQILTGVSHLFLAEFRQEQGGKKRRSHHRPVADGDEGLGFPVGSGWTMLPTTGANDRRTMDVNAGAQRRRPTRPPQANHPAIARVWRQTETSTHLLLAKKVA
jgi:SRSO17 transposase